MVKKTSVGPNKSIPKPAQGKILSQVHLVLFLLQAGISSFFKEPCFLLVEDGF